ncbi:MAG TPA: M20/M25/M40 family metallo-hydrolase [Acidimicrobiia bacterium]|nr:M20/M25/M40 family metallo-hydrolase [Acidimicrobiia bacterium]
MAPAGPDWKTLGDEAVEIARQYLRIDTTNPPGNETPAAEFLAGFLGDAGLEPTVLESEPGRGNVVARLPGSAGDPAGALCLLHHLDVVPADPSEWSVDPFGAEVRDGHLWGRGAIDMKGMGVMQMMTMLALARDRTTTLERDVLFVAVADEEAGGWKGAGWLTEHHPDLVACRDVINEGGYGLSDTRPPIMACALSEKAVRWVRLTARGTPGHGSMPPVEQAIEKLLAALGDIAAHPPALGLSPLVERTFRAMASGASGVRRKALEAILRPEARRLLPAVGRRLPRYQRALLGDTISMTRLDAGYKENVVPGTASATLDCRLVPETDPEEFVGRLSARMARYGVRCEVIFSDGPCGVSEGPLLPLLDAVCSESFPGVTFAPALCPAFTDSRFFRQLGADAYGLIPVMLSNDEVATFHGINERIPIEGLKKGCEVVYEITRRAGRS